MSQHNQHNHTVDPAGKLISCELGPKSCPAAQALYLSQIPEHKPTPYERSVVVVGVIAFALLLVAVIVLPPDMEVSAWWWVISLSWPVLLLYSLIGLAITSKRESKRKSEWLSKL